MFSHGSEGTDQKKAQRNKTNHKWNADSTDLTDENGSKKMQGFNPFD